MGRAGIEPATSRHPVDPALTRSVFHSGNALRVILCSRRPVSTIRSRGESAEDDFEARLECLAGLWFLWQAADHREQLDRCDVRSQACLLLCTLEEVREARLHR